MSPEAWAPFEEMDVVDALIHAKVERLQQWMRIVAIFFALDVHSWSVGLALADPSLPSLLQGPSPRIL